MPEIGTRHVNSVELEKIVEDIFSNSKPIAILERRFCTGNESPDFFDYLSILSDKISNWDKGRVFDDKSEIRWERERNDFHIVLIRDEGNIPDDWDKESLYPKCIREILLWGEKIEGNNQWYEKQVPRIIKYPANGSGKRVFAVLNEYRFKDGSTVYRFKEVKAK